MGYVIIKDYKTAKERWDNCFINNRQLAQLLDLNVITQEQYDQLWAEKYGPPAIDVPVEEPPAEDTPTEPDESGTPADAE